MTNDPTILCVSDIIIVQSCAISLSISLVLQNSITTHSCPKHVLYCSPICLHMLAPRSTQFSSYFLFLH